MTRRTRSWSWDNKTKTLAIDGKTERNLTSSDNVISTVGAATGSPPQVSAVGDDTNIDLRLVAKGDGNIEVRNNLEILTNKRIVDSAGTNVEFGDDIHMNSNKVTNLGTPSASTDAATKGYVDTYSLLLASGGTIAADLTVTGNLTVSGTTTSINTATLDVADNIINLNSDFTSGTPSENAGLQVLRGDSSNVQIRWNETSDSWEATRDGSTYVKIPNQALDTTDSPTFATVTYTTLNDGSNSITATAAEINVLDGITATVSELNILDGVTATASELNILDGVTATASELNILDGVTATTAELNLLDGVTATTTELNYVDGVTSNIQTQIDNISSSFTLSADSGSNDTFTTGGTLTFTGGTGIDTTVSDDTITIAIDSTVTTLTGTQTLTNKTLTSPTINAFSGTGNGSITGTLTVSGAVNFDNTTGSTSTSTGALVVDGGVGIAENLYVGGTIDMDRLSLTSSQTTVPPLQLTANSLNDGVGALRIDGAQADIFLNPSTATHTTVTFAVNGDQRLAFGMDSSSDFYITRRTSSTWYDDTFVLDRDTGLLSLGYGATVAGTLTYSTLNDGTTDLTSTVAELNILDGVTATATELNLLDGVTGTLVTEAGTQTLTNKTLTTPVISSISNTGTLTLPTSTDTLVGRATTDTLTNKTLTSPVVGTNLDLGARAPVQFYDTDSSNYIALRAPSTVASNYTFTLPAQDGTSQQVIVTDGAGNWSFANQSGGGGASGFQSSTLNTHPAAGGDEDLATGPSDDTAETPFESSGTDAFGVALGAVFDQMEPVGSTTITDLGDSEAYVGA